MPKYGEAPEAPKEELPKNLIFSLVGGGISGWIVASMDPTSAGIVTGLASAGLVGYKTENAVLSVLAGGMVGYLSYSLSGDSPAVLGLGTGMVTFMGLYQYVFAGEEGK